MQFTLVPRWIRLQKRTKKNDKKSLNARHIKLCRNLSTAISWFSYILCFSLERFFDQFNNKKIGTCFELILWKLYRWWLFFQFDFFFTIQSLSNCIQIPSKKSTKKYKKREFAQKWKWTQKSTTITVLNTIYLWWWWWLYSCRFVSFI